MENLNLDRAARIDEPLLTYYRNLYGGELITSMGEESEETARDMLADLLHWMNREGMDVEAQLRMAKDNFESELDEEEDHGIHMVIFEEDRRGVDPGFYFQIYMDSNPLDDVLEEGGPYHSKQEANTNGEIALSRHISSMGA